MLPGVYNSDPSQKLLQANVDNPRTDFESLWWIQSCWSLQIGHLLYDNACVCWEFVSSWCAAQLHISTWWEHLPFFGINELPISKLSTVYQVHKEAEFFIINSSCTIEENSVLSNAECFQRQCHTLKFPIFALLFLLQCVWSHFSEFLATLWHSALANITFLHLLLLPAVENHFWSFPSE